MMFRTLLLWFWFWPVMAK